MNQARHDRPAWPLFLIILLLGICFMLAAGQFAIQLVPSWSLVADVDSHINPNDQLAKWSDSAQIQPVSAEILTQPAWRATFLTPGASIFVPPIAMGIPSATSETNNTSAPPATAQAPSSSATPAQPTVANSSTPAIIIFPTNTTAPSSTKVPTHIPTVTPTRTGTATATATGTLVVVAHTATPTGTATATATGTLLVSTHTATPTGTATGTATATSASPASTPTPTGTATVTATATSTSVAAADTETPTATATATDTAIPPSSCKVTINLNTDPNPHPVASEMTCFTYTNTAPAYNNGAIFQIFSNGADGNVHDGCTVKGLVPGNSINYGVANSGGEMAFRINVTTAGTLTINISSWSGSPCP